ncbi:ABC transporter permease [Natronolimnohabitans innermongolicus]|uniref:Sodium ABC transporter permease n=1 Tax=Natronolimnohabitans innermongolicus JCM 12255 TaxID=1227499 RepID=L9XKE3_9EURY|nr:ABC transporter permease [Natronolimnohabitans innermongolicus]ELY62032.1 sodium ABC transporter permease [Natronolimnohabitans innermongolicus JCM 12255]
MSRDRDRTRDSDGAPSSDGGESTPVQRGPNPPTPTESDGGRSSPFGPRWAIVRRELRSLRSEKTIVLALAIQLVIAGFSSFLVVGLVSLYDPSSVDGQGYEVAITGTDEETVERLAALADERDGIQPRLADGDGASEAFDRGEVAALLEVTETPDGRLAVDASVPDEGLETTLLVVQLQEVLETLEHDERVANADSLETQPLPTPEEVEASPYVEFTYTILVPLLVFLPVFISGSIVVDSLIEERSRGTLELLRVSPLSVLDVVDAKLLSIAALAPLQVIAWLALLSVNGTGIAEPTALIALTAALALLITTAGAGIALLAPDRRQAQLSYSVGIVGLLVVAALLPEHPANTVAKLAIGSPTTVTWLSLAGYCLLAAGAFLAVRAGLERRSADDL